MFCYLGKFGQAVLWPSLPDPATKKKENCRSLIKLSAGYADQHGDNPELGWVPCMWTRLY